MALPLIVLILYVIGIIILLITAPKPTKDSTFEEYYTGDKVMVGIVVGLVMLMTGYTGSTWTGWVGFGASYGAFIAYAAVYMCIALGANYYIVGTRAWPLGKHYGLSTLGDLFELRYRNKYTKLTGGIIGLLSNITFITLEIVTIGYVVNAATNGYVSMTIGTLLGTLFMIAYLIAGGVRSLSRINTFQSVIMLAGIIITFAYIFFHLFDGIPEIMGLVQQHQPEALTLPGPAGIGTWPQWFSYTLLCGVGAFFYPLLFFKTFMNRDLKELRKSAIITNLGGMYVVIFEVLGSFAIIAYTFKTGYQFEDVEGALFDIMAHSGNMFMLTILCIFVLAASMGTIDACTLSIAGLISNDIIDSVKRIKHNDGIIGTPENTYVADNESNRTIRNSRITIVILLLGAFAVSLFELPLLVFIAMFNYQIVCNLFTPGVGGLFWKRATATGAISSMVVSTILTIILIAVGAAPFGMLPGVIGFIVGIIVFIGVSAITYKPELPEAKFYDEMRVVQETVLE